VRGVVGGEALGNLGEAIGDLVEDATEEVVGLRSFGGEGDGAEKGVGGIVEAAESVVGDTAGEFDLRGRRGFLEGGEGFRELLTIEERLGDFEVIDGESLDDSGVVRGKCRGFGGGVVSFG